MLSGSRRTMQASTMDSGVYGENEVFPSKRRGVHQID
jgi:hypothetical protein